jgi:hypothetical protein
MRRVRGVLQGNGRDLAGWRCVARVTHVGAPGTMTAVATCALALVLAMDVSASVTADDYALQRDGTAAALESAEVQRVVMFEARMAVTVIEWSNSAATVVPWRVVASPADLDALAAEIRSVSRSSQGLTGVTGAIRASLDALDEAPCVADRNVIDVSGDGAENVSQGPDVIRIRDMAQTRGVVINGLPIITPAEPKIAEWYDDHIRTKDGFVIPAQGFAEFGQAMRRKLSFEIAGYKGAGHAER